MVGQTNWERLFKAAMGDAKNAELLGFFKCSKDFKTKVLTTCLDVQTLTTPVFYPHMPYNELYQYSI